MTISNIDLIRESWAKAIVDPSAAARLFYSNLFTAIPKLESLFKSDMDAQGTKLMDTLDFIVDHLDETEELLPAARELAVRHVSYGVVAEDYAAVGDALLKTLSMALGSDFSKEAHEAWTETYTGLADHMIASAYQN